MRATSCSLVSALFLSGLTAASFLVFAPSPVSAETSYHKLKKHLRTTEHNTGVILGQIFADGDPDDSLEIDLILLDSDGCRSEHRHHKDNPSKPANTPAPAHKEPAKPEPAKPTHPAK
jgi:hypothetical protein